MPKHQIFATKLREFIRYTFKMRNVKIVQRKKLTKLFAG
jgi:hypothetical protein